MYLLRCGRNSQVSEGPRCTEGVWTLQEQSDARLCLWALQFILWQRAGTVLDARQYRSASPRAVWSKDKGRKQTNRTLTTHVSCHFCGGLVWRAHHSGARVLGNFPSRQADAASGLSEVW